MGLVLVNQVWPVYVKVCFVSRFPGFKAVCLAVVPVGFLAHFAVLLPVAALLSLEGVFEEVVQGCLPFCDLLVIDLLLILLGFVLRVYVLDVLVLSINPDRLRVVTCAAISTKVELVQRIS